MNKPLQRVLLSIQLIGEAANLKTAREAYMRILGKYTRPQDQAWIYYQYGALHWTETGDGTEARRLFELAIQKIGVSTASAIAAIPFPLEAYTCENMTLLSLSYKEYDRWADRLQRLQPESSFLPEHRPIIKLMYESGQPWSEVMLELGHSYCDPLVEHKAYSKAAAVFQLMLKNRRDLRLSRKLWGAAAGFYSAVIVRLVMACAHRSATHKVDEYIFIAQDARPLVEEYLNENPMDRDTRATYQDLMQILENAAALESAGEAERESGERGNWRSWNMSMSIGVGTVIASCFTVLEVKKNTTVPPTMSKYVSEALSIELDARYENHSRLSIYKLKGPIPAAGQWPFLVPDNYVDIQMKKRSWTPTRVKPPCGALAYTARTAEGNRVAIVQMMAVTERAMVLAMVSWAGMPGLNCFSVGFKPGMEMRTEDLLLAGLELCNANSA